MLVKLAIKTPAGRELVEVDFGLAADARAVSRWRVSAGRTTQAAKDAAEFSRLAGKRWRYYASRSEAAVSLDQLKSRVARSPTAEVGFLLVVRASWSLRRRLLGVCWCRRTWCNHLALDFAAVHPSALPGSGYGGVGTIMLQGLAIVAREIKCSLIWGEATELSAPFYEKILGTTGIRDHFFLRQPILRKLQSDADAFISNHPAQ
jgi:hypothetical protein